MSHDPKSHDPKSHDPKSHDHQNPHSHGHDHSHDHDHDHDHHHSHDHSDDWHSDRYVADWIARDARRMAERMPILEALIAAVPFRADAAIDVLDVGAGTGVVTEAVLDAYYQNLYAAGFLYSADRAFVKDCKHPCLVMAGNDDAHPYPISEQTAQLWPNAGFIKDWKTGAALEEAKRLVEAFWAKHTPK